MRENFSLIGEKQAVLCEAFGVRYHRYLRSAQWKNIRTLMIRLAGNKCQKCGHGSSAFEVHHLTYARLGAERRSDLMVLCKTCHEFADREREVRQFFESESRLFAAYMATKFGEGWEVRECEELIIQEQERFQIWKSVKEENGDWHG